MPRFEFVSNRYPTTPGCYLMKDGQERIIYVGKAKNLRRRLASYFQSRNQDHKTRRLVATIREIEVILVNNETESLILENNLIKYYRPRFNRALMREGSGYYYIALTGERLPRFLPYRKDRFNKQVELAQNEQQIQRFGPYVSRVFRDTLLEFVIEHFQLRTCNPLPNKVCLSYHLGICSGVCERKVTEARYMADIKRAVAFLSDQHTAILRQIAAEMRRCAENLAFEKAQRLKTQIEAMQAVLERQIVERDVAHDQNVVYFGGDKVLVATIEQGALRSMQMFALPSAANYAQACVDFLSACYQSTCPTELIVNHAQLLDEIAAALTNRHQQAVTITLPTQETSQDLMQLCAMNYAYRRSFIDHS